MNFPAAIAAQIRGVKVQVAPLVEFQFASSTVRVWSGFGSLPTSDSKLWSGIGELGEVSGLDQAINGVAPTQTFTVSGVDARFANLAREERHEYFRRSAVTYLQFFDEDWQTLDAPFAVTFRLMDTCKSSRTQTEDGTVYRTAVTAETAFETRRLPPRGYYTDRDQKLRYGDDRGLEFVAGIDGRNITFPDY